MSGWAPWRRLALAGAWLACAACTPGRAEVVEAVRAYDAALATAYRTGDAGPLSRFADPDEVRRVTVLLEIKKESGLVLESALESFEATRVEVRGAEATVTTAERWRYHDRPLDPTRPAGEVHLADMVLSYRLAREGGAWKVRSASTDSSRDLLPEGHRPGR